MKISQRCPKCQSTRLWVVDRVSQRNTEPVDPRPDTRHVPLTAVTLTAYEWWIIKGTKCVEVGTLEVWICAQCGFTEWYANDVNEKLGKLAEHPETGVRLIDPVNNRGPFR